MQTIILIIVGLLGAFNVFVFIYISTFLKTKLDLAFKSLEENTNKLEELYIPVLTVLEKHFTDVENYKAAINCRDLINMYTKETQNNK